MPFPHVFEPLTIRHRTLKSRINFGAHTANMAEGGLPGERHIGYYRERALGGAGMIVVEPVPVHRTAVLTRGNFRHDDDAIIPAFRRLTDTCREANPDIVMIQQLYHVGQHGDADVSFAPNWSPSGLPSYHDADGSHAMTESEIDEVIAGFVAGARRAQDAGFDGIEIFAAYNALVDQFWTPWSNRRTDAWGGSFDARMRFSCTLLEQIRATCGDQFIVGLAVSMDSRSKPALTIEQLAEIVAWHDERRLMDYVTCGTGSYFDFYPIIPVSLYEQQLGVPFAAALKRVVKHAVVQAESHIRTPAAAEAVLAAGEADMVSIVRGQIADPYLVTKAREDRPEDVRPCISCNQLCWGRRSRDYWISCLGNASAGREWRTGDMPSPAEAPRSVLVVGGGPAGLEAARVSAERGHWVTLLERDAQLGGQFRLAGRQPSRGQILDLLAWFEHRLSVLGVDVRLGTDASADDVEGFRADEVIVATGSRPPVSGFQRALPMVDRMPGSERADAVSIQDVLAEAVPVGRRVIVVDDVGDWRGLGTALYLAERGHAVTIVTSAAVVGGGLYHSAADGPLRARFSAAGGIMRPATVVLSWDGDGATVRTAANGGSKERIAADTLVIAETAVAETALADELRRRGVAFEAIGDCVAPRRASLAIYEGRELALRV